MIVVEFGWSGKFIMKSSDALKLVEVLEKAERYDEKWQKDEDGGTTYHVWPTDPTDMPSMKVVGESAYQMAKLAGKPEKK